MLHFFKEVQDEIARLISVWRAAVRTKQFWLVTALLCVIMFFIWIAIDLALSYDDFAIIIGNRARCRGSGDIGSFIMLVAMLAFILTSFLSVGELFNFLEARRHRKTYSSSYLFLFMGLMVTTGLGGWYAMKALC